MATTYTTNYNLGKQENHADKFDMDVITDNADKIDAALAGLQSGIDGKQATLTTAQLAAVNSGIDSTKVAQIETNKNNISTITPALQECVDNGAKNLVNVPDITISASGGGYVTANNNVVLPAGKYVIIFNATATSGVLLTSFKDSGGNTIGSLELAMNGGQIKGTIFLSAQSSYFNAFANQPTTVTKYMIITEAMYDAGFTDYQPYALSNAELTTNILSLAALRTYRLPTNDTSYSFTSLDGINDTTRFKYALLVGGGTASTPTNALVWLVFISTDGACTITKIIGNGTQVLTGAVSGTTLNITASATIYGGLRLIWLG